MAAADISGALARTLQFLRAERGWSLDQLTARSGVSKGVLVALEQGRANPNLATLARISDAFGVPVTRLVDVPDQPSVRITGPAESRVLWHGPSGGTGTILGATGSAVGGGTVTVDADAGGDIRRRRACPGDPGDGLGRERRAHTCRSRASGTSSPTSTAVADFRRVSRAKSRSN